MDFLSHVRAGFPALWVQTQEPSRTISEWGGEAVKVGYKAFSWDCQSGVQDVMNGFKKDLRDPLEAISFLATINQKSVIFLQNFHRFLRGDASIDIIQLIYNLMDQYKASGKTIIILAPCIEIPSELSKVFTALSFDLPTKDDLKKILDYMADSSKKPLPDDNKQDAILEAGKGLAAFEFENALALSLVAKKSFDPLIVMDQKSQLLKKNATLTMENDDETLGNLGGMENLKEFVLRTIRSQYSKGILLLGVPGTGKSHFSKAVGKAVGWPTVGLDFGKFFGSLVGESEQRTREAFQVIDAFAPCVLRTDEIEKGLSGMQSSGQTDGGTGSRVGMTYLNWKQDHKSRVYEVGTCNDISKLPPEFLRAERWDAIFFVDLPTDRERGIILDLYRKQYGVKGEPSHNLQGWSGAEIKSLCRIAAMMKCTLQEAERYVIPLSQSMADKIQSLREWAKTRTIPATLQTEAPKPTGRRVE